MLWALAIKPGSCPGLARKAHDSVHCVLRGWFTWVAGYEIFSPVQSRAGLLVANIGRDVRHGI